MDPFSSSSEDDDFFISMMYEEHMKWLEDSSDEEVLRTRTVKMNRNREAAHDRLFQDYFAEDCVYDEKDFKRRFRLSRNLFMRIVNTLENRYRFFQLKYDVRGRRGFTALQKCCAAIRMMAYGTSGDAMDEYLKMSERTARESLYRFSRGIISIFGGIYLRKPSTSDVQALYAAHEARWGFPGMVGSIDCTHWSWRNCPMAWRGQYGRGDHGGVPSLILEAVASTDLWIWHAFFGVPESHNDRTVLDQSPIFDDILSGKAPDLPFTVNENQYNFGYYLTDGIYPRFSTFVKAIRYPTTPRDKLFTKRQEGARKDVERAFGVLKAKWHIVKNAARPYELENLRSIMYACIIMHNMVVEEKGRNIATYIPSEPTHKQFPPVAPNFYIELST